MVPPLSDVIMQKGVKVHFNDGRLVTVYAEKRKLLVVLEPLQFSKNGSSFPDLPGARENSPSCSWQCYLLQPQVKQP